jgi:hypothetical protein
MSEFQKQAEQNENALADQGYQHGYDFADTIDDPSGWADEVLALAGRAESDLYESAYTDWYAIGRGRADTGREEYARNHVRGQVSRARKLLGR